MTAIQRNLFVGIGIAVVLGTGAYFLLVEKRIPFMGSTTATTTPEVATTTPVGEGISIVTKDGTIVKAVPVDQGTVVPPPQTNRQISIAASIAPDAAAALRQGIETLEAKLKADPTRVDLWLNLGSYLLIAQDYEGARLAWEYVATAGPSNINYIAYGNLGDLYMYYLVDYPKAEAEYKKAIALKPDVIDYYRHMYVFYTQLYKTNTSAAADILAQGLKANPNNPDLLKLQAELKAKSN